MPSEIETVLNSIGVPPASRMPSFTCDRELAQVVVAGADLDPGVGDADERAAQILVGEAGRAEHGARRGAAGPVGQCGAAPLERMSGHVIGVSCDSRASRSGAGRASPVKIQTAVPGFG